jgi:hypothetical protein
VTGLLKDLMHDRADQLSPPVLDLEAITREGDRRVRRRHLVGGASGLAAVVALAALAPVVLDGDGGVDKDRTAVSEAAVLTWAEGDAIHADGRTIDIGHDIHAFVATDQGYVLIDPEGAVWSWSGGQAERVGTAITDPSSSSVVLMADGPWAGWMDSEKDGFVFLDQATGTVRRTPASPGAGDDGESRLRMFAIDGTTAYVSIAREVVGIDLASGDLAVVGALQAGADIDDVEGGLILHSVSKDDREVTVASRDLASDRPALGVMGGDLSPDGSYVMSENSATESDTFTLLRLPGGEELTPAVAKDYDFFLGYAWADQDTYTAFGMRGLGGSDERAVAIDLLVCEVETRACEVADEGPASFRDFQLPVGMHIVG